MSRWPSLLLAGTGLLACHLAFGRIENPPEKLDEIIVSGERAGPGLWHVQRGAAQLWIFGTVSPLPKNMTWRSKQLERILDGTDQLLVAKPVEIGIARALWLLVTQRDLLMLGHGKKLKDVMPADLHARFAVHRAKFTKDGDKWEKFRPLIAAAFLEEDALHAVGLSTRLDLADEVRSLARKHHVRISIHLESLFGNYQELPMSDKIATVHWEGRGKQGMGKISTQTEALKSYPYGFASRFEDDKRGTNPEELLAAAHAACFTMAFSFGCDAAGFSTTAVDCQAAVRLVLKGGGFSIEHIGLKLEASVPGIDEATFQKIAAKAKQDCPLSKALASVPEITLTAILR